jgi:hypothetical protein
MSMILAPALFVSPIVPPAFASATWYDRGNTSGNGWTVFSGANLSAFSFAIFVVGISNNNAMSVGAGSTAGWTLLGANQSVTSGLSTIAQFAVFYKANPTANETLQISAGGANAGSLVGGYLIGATGADSIASASTKSSGTGSADPNPPSKDAGAVRDHLWIAVAGNRSTSITPSAAPAGYSNFTAQVGQAQASGTIPGLAFATRQATNQTEDPGVFTQASAPWCTFTIAVYHS